MGEQLISVSRWATGNEDQLQRELTSSAGPEAPPFPQEIMELPDYNKISFKEQAPVPLGEVLPDASPQALDLLGQFLLYPPRQRISASQVG